jgi:hypothetical protein
MGKQGRQTVENKFCLQVTVPCLKRMLDQFDDSKKAGTQQK